MTQSRHSCACTEHKDDVADDGPLHSVQEQGNSGLGTRGSLRRDKRRGCRCSNA